MDNLLHEQMGDAVEVLVVDMDLDLEPAGMEWLVRVERRFPHVRIIVVSDAGNEIPQDVHVLPKSWRSLGGFTEAFVSDVRQIPATMARENCF